MAHRKLSYIIFSIILLVLAVVFIIDQNQEVTIAADSDLYIEQEENFTFSEFRSKKVKYLVLHCTASQAGVDHSKQWFLDFFKNERKFSRPGYNIIIAPNGRKDVLVPFDNDGYVQFNELANGVAGINSEAIHMSYQGGIDKRGNPKDTRTAAQKEALDEEVKKIKLKFPWIKVKGHNEFAQKACPSFNVRQEYVIYNN
jgi:N-acetylmuramoyl-L-alanine amidase